MRFRNRTYEVLEELRIGGKKYCVVDRLSDQHERFQAISRSEVLGQFMCAVQIVRDSAKVRRRLRLLKKAEKESRQLPRILDVHHRGGSITVVLEWVDGPNLAQVLYDPEKKRRRQFSTQEATRVIRQLAHNVNALDRYGGIVHGDIKPENLIVPKALVLRLIDYGCCWFVEETSRLAEGFTEGASPGYAAPELARILSGDDRMGHPSFQSDQFSVSVVYYELLTGKLPYDGLGGQAGITKERIERYGPRLELPSQQPLDRNRLPAGTWAAIDRVVCRGLALSPSDRYPTGRDWLADLERAHRCFQSPPPLSPSKQAFGKSLLRISDAWEAFRERVRK